MSSKKAAKAKKSAVKTVADKKRGVRYTADFKKEVVDFVTQFNAKNGRGGQSEAARKYDLSILTVSSWLKKGSLGAVRTKAGSDPQLAKNINALLDLSDQIRKLEGDLDKLRAKYDTLRASVQAAL